MKINGLQNYNPYLRNDGEERQVSQSEIAGKTFKTESKKATDKNDTISQENNILRNPNKLITSQERRFFKKMFPESAQQIENHILFNRNGKVNTPAVTKGTIVDGRV